MNTPVRAQKWMPLLVVEMLLVIVTFSGCGAGNSSPTYSILPASNSFQQSSSSVTNKLDILWVVDNSSSMSPLQTNLTTNFNSFISNFASKGYDFKMAVTTTDAYLADPNLYNYSPSDSSLAQFKDGTDATSHDGIFVITPITPNLNNVFVNNATQGQNGSGDERAFASLKTAMGSSLNSGFLRSNSFFAVIIISDEDDFSSEQRLQGSWQYPTNSSNYVADHSYSYSGLDTVGSYESYLDSLTATTGALRRYNVSAITVLDNTCLSSHVSSSPSSIIGQRYIQIANDTNGVLGSVCDTSFSTSLNAIQSKIAELSTAFHLTRAPNVSSIVVEVNGAVVSQGATNGWTYDTPSNSIIFHGTAIPQQNATINVNFDPLTAAT